MAYVTAAELRAWLRIDTTDDDAQLTLACSAAQAYIERATGRRFEAAADTTRYFAALPGVYGGAILDPDTLQFDDDLAALTSITNGDGTTISTSDVVLLPLNTRPAWGVRIVSDSVGWSYGDRNPYGAGRVAITGRWAWSTTAGADVVEATKELARHMYQNRDQSAYASMPGVSPDGTPIMPPGVPKLVTRFISGYARRS